jgi:hypothetical protein
MANVTTILCGLHALRWHSKKAAAAAAASVGDLTNVLDKTVSLGIVELLLHPSESYTDEHNAFVNSIPPHVKELVCFPPNAITWLLFSVSTPKSAC